VALYKCCLLLLLLLLCISIWDGLDLFYWQPTVIAGNYKVDRNKISVSGISSGGAMATQLHVAYSSVFMGVGIIAGCKHSLDCDCDILT